MPAQQDVLEERFASAMRVDSSDEQDQQDEEKHDEQDLEFQEDHGGSEQGDYSDNGDNGERIAVDEHQRESDGRMLARSGSAASSASSFDREYDDFDGPASYSESAAIQSKKYLERDQVKLALEQEERARRLNKIRARRQHLDKWTNKTARSPFHVNLVADNERLDEEHRLRLLERSRRAREMERRARQAKSEVILKALTESSDLELLRREKRAIIDEEKRLKALLDLEKTNSHRKMDLLAARNAEKRRRQEKEEFRRRQRQQELQAREQQYKQLLKEKLALED